MEEFYHRIVQETIESYIAILFIDWNSFFTLVKKAASNMRGILSFETIEMFMDDYEICVIITAIINMDLPLEQALY